MRFICREHFRTEPATAIKLILTLPPEHEAAPFGLIGMADVRRLLRSGESLHRPARHEGVRHDGVRHDPAYA